MKEEIKTCGLFALSALVFSTALSVLWSAPSYAASEYDNAYKTTEDLSVYFEKGYSSTYKDLEGPRVDFSKDYVGYISSPENWVPNQFKQEYIDSFKKSLDTGSWAVSMRSDTNDKNKTSRSLVLFWVEEGDFNLEWHPEYLGVRGAKQISLFYSTNWMNPFKPRVYYVYNGSTHQNYLSYPDTVSNAFISQRSGTFDYPAGYSGPPVSETLELKQKYTPRAMLSVSDKHVDGNICMDAKYAQCNIPPGVAVGVSYKVKEQLTGNVVFEDAGMLNSSKMVFSFDVKDYSTYVFEADYYVPIPYIQPKNHEYNRLVMPFPIDGSSYMTTSEKQNCNSDGVCELASVLRDCKQFWGDISTLGQAINCELYNFGAALNQFFSRLFRPDTVLLRLKMDELQAKLESSLGMVYQFVEWVFGTAKGIITAPQHFACNHRFGPFFGRDINLNMCVMQERYPQMWGVAVLVIRTTAVFMAIMGLVRGVSSVTRVLPIKNGSYSQ